MDYIVSGHGGRWAIPTHMVYPTGGFSVSFFVKDGNILTNAAAWPIYNHLLAGDEASVQAQIAETVLSGQPAYNYSCWNYPQLGANSGVFKVGAISTNNPVLSLSAYTEQNPLTLGRLLELLPQPGRIFWVACQVVS